MPLTGAAGIPFRRLTEPLILPVGPTAQLFTVPDGFIPQEANAFWVVSPNLFWVRLKGGGSNSLVVTESTGWLWKPGYSDVFTTQFPKYMSTLAVSRQGISVGTGTIEIAYGIGG